jgi:hypothetical protein
MMVGEFCYGLCGGDVVTHRVDCIVLLIFLFLS